jgi:hypothetical protein
MVFEEGIVVPLATRHQHLLIKPWFRRYPIPPLGRPSWKDVVIEPRSRGPDGASSEAGCGWTDGAIDGIIRYRRKTRPGFRRGRRATMQTDVRGEKAP